MKITLDMPDSAIRVVNGEDEKGNPVRGIVINGIVAGYITREDSLSNADWENTLNHIYAHRIMGEFMAHFEDGVDPNPLRTQSPTGRPMRFSNWAEFERMDSHGEF